MTSVPDKSKVVVRGSFTSNAWTETMPLTNKNGDGIYEGTFSQETAINAIEFKFMNNKQLSIRNIDEFNIDGDFVESQAFAYLAIRSFLNLPISFPNTTRCKKLSSGGEIIKNF